MGYETVEAIQVRLLGRDGIILWVGSPENPPLTILAESIEREDCRVFPKPNELGPVFEYDLDYPTAIWHLVNKIPGTGETSADDA